MSLTLLCLCLLGSACSVVISEKPVGLEPANLKASELNGIWAGVADSDDEYAIITVDAKESHKILAQAPDPKVIHEKINLESQAFEIWKHRDQLYWNYYIPEENGYLFGRMRLEKNLIILWLAKPEAFAKAVRENRIQGVFKHPEKANQQIPQLKAHPPSAIEHQSDSAEDPMEPKDIRLTGSSIKLLEVIEAEDASLFYHWEEPIILHRKLKH